MKLAFERDFTWYHVTLVLPVLIAEILLLADLGEY